MKQIDNLIPSLRKNIYSMTRTDVSTLSKPSISPQNHYLECCSLMRGNSPTEVVSTTVELI